MARVRRLREWIPSFENTLRRCYSTVRGLRNSRTDLRVRQPVAGQLGDLPLLRGWLVARLDRPFAHPFAGRQQLGPGALGKSIGTDRGEQVMRAAQLLTRVQPAILTPQPLPVVQPGTGEVPAIRDGPSDSIASWYSASATSPSSTSARDRAWHPIAHRVPLAMGRCSSRSFAPLWLVPRQ